MNLSNRQEQEKRATQKAFGRRLAALRNEANVTQEKFSFMLGLDRTYISYIERGERNPSLYVLWKMARALKVRLKDLMDF